MLLLIDQDNVLADFTRVLYTEMCARGHRDRACPPNKQTTYPLEDHYPPDLLGELKAIYTAEGFFRSLPPIEGAIQAVREMVAEGIDVRICTHPTRPIATASERSTSGSIATWALSSPPA